MHRLFLLLFLTTLLSFQYGSGRLLPGKYERRLHHQNFQSFNFLNNDSVEIETRLGKYALPPINGNYLVFHDSLFIWTTCNSSNPHYDSVAVQSRNYNLSYRIKSITDQRIVLIQLVWPTVDCSYGAYEEQFTLRKTD